MKTPVKLATLFMCGLITSPVLADEARLVQMINALEKRITTLEKEFEEISGKDRWKDPILWQRIKKEMSAKDVRKLLGKPARVEEQIFTSWYYHPTSKLHSFVWFDEGKVLGWEIPD